MLLSSSTTQPPPSFWALFSGTVLVDTAGRVFLTKLGELIWPNAFANMKASCSPGLSWQEFYRLALQAKPYADFLLEQTQYLQGLPGDSPERELMSELLGLEHRSRQSGPAQVVRMLPGIRPSRQRRQP